MFGHQSHTTVGRLLRGSVAGMIGGAAGAWVMNNFHEPIAARRPGASEASSSASAARKSKRTSKRHHHNGGQHGGGEEPTVAVAEAVSERVFDHELSASEKKIAGPAVHFGYATLVGGLYGGLAELRPNVKIGMGMGYGIALWALGHEAALPSLGLTPPPTRTPAREHADSLAAHLCYGLTLDCVRRISKLFL